MSAVDQVSDALPYVPLVPYNGTIPTGGDSATQDLNVFYQSGDIAWMLTSTALVLLMIPGVGFFYSGLARRKSALSLICLSMLAIAVVNVQWFFWGYSLSFSSSAGPFIGNLDNMGYRNVLAKPSIGSSRIPDMIFAMYQGMFAAMTVALATGATAERGRVLPCVIFMFVWTTLVYNPIAEWTWNPNGWSAKLGVLDFAGGTPVHITSGGAALAYSYVLGKRTGFGTEKLNYRPHNVTHIILGTIFLFVGWLGFNAGSALSANLRAAMAAMVTILSASFGGLAWCLLDYRFEGKWSVVGFCSGVVAGLVAITPASGSVAPWAAAIIGIWAGIGCNLAVQFKHKISADDCLDVFALHACGGLIGCISTGFFAADYIAHLDGVTVIKGGWVNHHWIQPAYQLADAVAGLTWSFTMTFILLTAMKLIGKYIPALKLRIDADAEELGVDEAELGEFAYDYVEHRRELKSSESEISSHGVPSVDDFGHNSIVESGKEVSAHARGLQSSDSTHSSIHSR